MFGIGPSLHDIDVQEPPALCVCIESRACTLNLSCLLRLLFESEAMHGQAMREDELYEGCCLITRE